MAGKQNSNIHVAFKIFLRRCIALMAVMGRSWVQLTNLIKSALKYSPIYWVRVLLSTSKGHCEGQSYCGVKGQSYRLSTGDHGWQAECKHTCSLFPFKILLRRCITLMAVMGRSWVQLTNLIKSALKYSPILLLSTCITEYRYKSLSSQTVGGIFQQ